MDASMKISIALAQMHIAFGDTQCNLNQVRSLAKEASEKKAQLLLLPELWSTSYDLQRGHQLAQENQEIVRELYILAEKYNIAIGGSLLIAESGEIFNRFLLISPTEDIIASYDKIHLFRLLDEHTWLSGGNHIQSVNFAGGTAGLAICYDLRFPELFRKYALGRANIIFIAAEWPAERIEHWQILLRARAIENQLFIAAVNCVGKSGDQIYGGASAVIDPMGRVLIEGSPDMEQLLYASVSLNEIENVREKIPVFKDRRPDVYG
jgi:omega-amidase